MNSIERIAKLSGIYTITEAFGEKKYADRDKAGLQAVKKELQGIMATAARASFKYKNAAEELKLVDECLKKLDEPEKKEVKEGEEAGTVEPVLEAKDDDKKDDDKEDKKDSDEKDDDKDSKKDEDDKEDKKDSDKEDDKPAFLKDKKDDKDEKKSEKKDDDKEEKDDKDSDDKKEDKKDDSEKKDDKEGDEKTVKVEVKVEEAVGEEYVVAVGGDGQIWSFLGLERGGNLEDAIRYSSKEEAESRAYDKNTWHNGPGAWFAMPVSKAQEWVAKKAGAVEESVEDIVARILEKDLTPTEVEVDYQNGPTENSGVKFEQGTKIRLPAAVKAEVKQRITELNQAILRYDDKGYDDKSIKQQAVDCLNQILQDLSTNDLEGVKKAQIYFETLMSPLTDFFPPKLINWLANAANPYVGDAESA